MRYNTRPYVWGEFLFLKGKLKMSRFEKLILTENDKDIELIFKPHREGIKSLSKEEIEQYIGFNIEEINKTNMNVKTIIICQETQQFLRKNKEILLKNIINKEEEENER